MKITLSQLCENISKKISIDAKDLDVLAWFPLDNVAMSKNEENPRSYLYWEYKALSEKEKLMYLSVYYKDLFLLRMDIQGVSPNDNKLYQLLDIDFKNDCIGPGFYYNYPYFKLDGRQAKDAKSKKNYNEFLKSVKFDADNVTFFKSNIKNITLLDVVKQADNEGEI